MATITPTNMLCLSNDIPIYCSPWIEYWDSKACFIPDVTGSISGVVTLKGVLMPGELVSLYYRPNGKKIGSVLTDNNGSFTFQHLDKNSNQYYAVARLKGTYIEPEKYNALIYDLLQPI
jgi:hypothetical protein